MCYFVFRNHIEKDEDDINNKLNNKNNMNNICNDSGNDYDITTTTNTKIIRQNKKKIKKIKKYKFEKNKICRPLIRYGNELLIDHCDMKPISIAIVGESKQYVLRLSHSISSGRMISDNEFLKLPEIIYKENVECPYRTRLIPIELNCFYDSPDKLQLDYNQLFSSIKVWIIVVSPENADINSWYTKYHGQWNNIISKHYPKSRRIIACVQPVDHLDDESSSYHISNSVDVKVKHVALYSMVCIYLLSLHTILSILNI